MIKSCTVSMFTAAEAEQISFHRNSNVFKQGENRETLSFFPLRQDIQGLCVRRTGFPLNLQPVCIDLLPQLQHLQQDTLGQRQGD